jgi:hypothetical protein
MGWFFHESDPMGGAAGEAFANTLKSPGMHPEHVLAREAIQNSVDAGLAGAKVEVHFRASAVTGAKKAAFVEASDLADIAARLKELELTGPNCLLTLDKPRAPLQLLYVEDFNAEGLSGDPHDKGSNFYRLLLSLGDRSKSRTAHGTGGSYGFGKSVYSSSSAIQTIFAYTRFKAEDGVERTRIFGCGYFVSHDFKKMSYSGRAWLGSKSHKDGHGRVVVDPLENAAADTLAKKLGITLRATGERGTSILIVDAAVDIPSIVRGVEDWWWPRLIENKLDVQIHDADGTVHFPKPKKNAVLKPFIEAFDIARTRAVAKTGTQKFAPFQREGDVAMGTCGFVVVPLDANGNPTVSGDRANAVALIRGPLMVVAYQAVSQASPPIVGAYMAPEEDVVEQALRKSEPPAHDRWDPESTNLRDETGKNRKLVESILSRIKGGLRRFQLEAAPPTPAKQRRMTQLERALGSLFKPQGHGGSVVPDAGPSPLHLEFARPAFAEATDDGMLRLKSTFSIRLDDKSEEDEVDLRLRMNCPVLEDDNEEGEDLKLTIEVDGVAAKIDETDPWVYRFKLAKHAKAKFKIESESYDPAWTVRLRPDFEREGAL